MEKEVLQNKINALAQKHTQADELWEAETIESDVEKIVIDYCIEKGYNINGFPHKLLEKNIDIEEFCDSNGIDISDAYKQYLDYLIIENEDVGEIMWYYSTTFWPNQYDSKIEYINIVKTLMESEGGIKDWEIN